MKFICLGYMDEAKWDQISESDRTALMEECFAYDDELRRGVVIFQKLKIIKGLTK